MHKFAHITYAWLLYTKTLLKASNKWIKLSFLWIVYIFMSTILCKHVRMIWTKLTPDQDVVSIAKRLHNILPFMTFVAFHENFWLILQFRGFVQITDVLFFFFSPYLMSSILKSILQILSVRLSQELFLSKICWIYR